jgi:ectoine hydroxylase-related dioxygenase (phytanoyl-CoA dioxygenase family)
MAPQAMRGFANPQPRSRGRLAREATSMLTDQQRLHFQTFGFIVQKQIFTPAEMEVISQRFDEVLDQDRQGKEFPGEKRQGVIAFIEQRPELARLVDDDRIYEPLEQLLGPDPTWLGSDGNLYVGNTRWHSDFSTPYRRIKVAFYLDPVGKQSGCLRVIPGSHLPGLHERLKKAVPTDEAADSPYGLDGADMPCFPIESSPGDVVFFNQNLLHASYGGKSGRRMFTINLGAKPASAADFEDLSRMYESTRQSFRSDMQFTPTDRLLTDVFLHSNSPRVQKMIAPLLELGFA